MHSDPVPQEESNTLHLRIDYLGRTIGIPHGYSGLPDTDELLNGFSKEKYITPDWLCLFNRSSIDFTAQFQCILKERAT